MSADEFWNGSPSLVNGYREKHRLELESKNEELWLQGFYVFEALQVVVGNALSKKGAKKAEYPSKPHRITPLTKAEKEAEKAKMVEDFRQQLMALDRKFKAKHNKQGGEVK